MSMGRRRSKADDHDRNAGPAARGLPLPDRAGRLHRRHRPARPALRLHSAQPARECPDRRHRHRGGAGGSRGRGSLHRRRPGGRRRRRAALRLAHPFEGRLADGRAAASGAGDRPGAPCRRPGRGRHRRHPGAGARRGRAGPRRLCRGARGRRPGRGAEARRAAGARRGAGQPLLRLASGRSRSGRRGDRPGGAGGAARPHQQPPRPQRDGAARRDRRVRPRHRRAHALHDQPEPARDPAADGRLRAAHPRSAAARRRPRCRRRLRLEDLPLRRGGDRHLGRRQVAPAGQMEGRPLRELHVGRARPRPRDPCRAGARRAGEVPGAQGLDRRQHGRVPVDLRPLHPDLPLRDAPRRHLHDTRDLRRDQGGLHQHRAGRRLSRRRKTRGDLSPRAHRRHCRRRARHGPGRAAPAQLHPGRTPIRIRRRWRCNTTAAITPPPSSWR